MTRLAQINGLVAGEKTRCNVRRDEIHHLIQRNAGLLTGLIRNYAPSDDEGEQLPGEAARVQVRVESDVLPELRRTMSRMFDLQLTQDTANTAAFADIIVDGQVLLRKVPITYLLFLHKALTDIRTIVMKLPVLDPAEAWTWDDDLGLWRSMPALTARSKKVPRNHVKAEATDRHPAQVEVYQEDVRVGTWSTTKLSGAIPARSVRAIEGRIAKLVDAVAIARDEANTVVVTDRHAAEAVFGWLLAGELVPAAD